MSQIRKHTFEAISLLTATSGLLDVTIIPAMNQPDWLIPSSLVLSVEPYDERIWTYLWHEQEVSIFHLLPRDVTPDTIIVLEGNTVVHRIGLQTKGEVTTRQVRISDVQDIDLPDRYTEVAYDNMKDNKARDEANNWYDSDNKTDNDKAPKQIRFRENVILSYLFQTVQMNDQVYIIPDLDKIAHQLVDLDS